jgi:hypothetical protein
MKRLSKGNVISDLLFIATLTYGGFMSFSAHLMLKHGIAQRPLYRVSNQKDSKARIFGYNINYQNLAPEALSSLKHPFILAFGFERVKRLDRTHPGPILQHLKDKENTTIVIHDPGEIRGKERKQLLDYLRQWKVITIRPAVKRYLKEELRCGKYIYVSPILQVPQA